VNTSSRVGITPIVAGASASGGTTWIWIGNPN
jgi:hypothetical protein